MTEKETQPAEQPVCLVIGGCGDIGSAVASRLAAKGCLVVAAGRRGDVPRGSLPLGVQEYLRLDVTAEDEVVAAFEWLKGRFGGLDLLVYAPGAPIKAGPLLRGSSQAWDEQQALHSRGAFLASQQAGRLMRKARRGRIVHIASVAGDSPVLPGYSAYAAAKASMVSLTKSLNLELNKVGVLATAVSPSYVATKSWQDAGVDTSRYLHHDDIADAVEFLWRLSPRVRIEELTLDILAGSRE